MNAAGSPQRLQWLLGSSAAPLGPRSRTGGGKWNQWCIHTQLRGSAIDAYVVAGASCRHTPSTGCQGRQAGRARACCEHPGSCKGPWISACSPTAAQPTWVCIRHGRCLQQQESTGSGQVHSWRIQYTSTHTVMGHRGCCRVLTQRAGLAAGEVPGL